MIQLGRLWRRSVAALVVVLAVVAIIAHHYGWGDGTRLISRTNGSSSGTVSAPGARQYYSVYVGQVCVSGEGPAWIGSIEPVDARGGLKVTDISVVPPSRERWGALPGRLRDEPSFRGSRTVSDLCRDGVGASDLYIEVFKPRTEDVWAPEYRINYVLYGHVRSAHVRFGFGICEKDLDHCDLP